MLDPLSVRCFGATWCRSRKLPPPPPAREGSPRRLFCAYSLHFPITVRAGGKFVRLARSPRLLLFPPAPPLLSRFFLIYEVFRCIGWRFVRPFELLTPPQESRNLSYTCFKPCPAKMGALRTKGVNFLYFNTTAVLYLVCRQSTGALSPKPGRKLHNDGPSFLEGD